MFSDNATWSFIWNVTDLTFLRSATNLTLDFKVFDKFDKSGSVIMSVRYCGCEQISQCDFGNAVVKQGML